MEVTHSLSHSIYIYICIQFPTFSPSFSASRDISGVVVLIGIAFCSRISACFAFVGSSIGCLVGYLMGANVQQIELGLWGYNAVLGTMAIGTHSQSTEIDLQYGEISILFLNLLFHIAIDLFSLGGMFYTLNVTTSFLAVMCGVFSTILLGTFKTIVSNIEHIQLVEFRV